MNEIIKLSTYNCRPFVFVEYEIIKEVLKGHFMVCRLQNLNETRVVHPAKYSIDRVTNNESDLAACVFWQISLMMYFQNTFFTNTVSTTVTALPPNSRLVDYLN